MVKFDFANNCFYDDEEENDRASIGTGRMAPVYHDIYNEDDNEDSGYFEMCEYYNDSY